MPQHNVARERRRRQPKMFEMDAHIGAEDLNLLYMKDERPHVGFPEKSYTAYAERLVRKGHRVEVVEQVETPAMLQERNLARRKKGLKNDTVVRRQKVAVLTRGTHVEETTLETWPKVPTRDYQGTTNTRDY